MNNVSVLNNRLAKASKKFTKACEQIKLLKQQLTVYISMLSSYTTDNQPSTSNNNQIQSTQILTRAEQKELDRKPGYNAILSREMIRQKIEALQDFKNIVFMYAHQKADEITKLQCELYGEDAVRDAYDNNSSSSQEYTPEFDNTVESEDVQETNSDDLTHASDSAWENSYWGNYNEQEQPFLADSESSHLSHRPSQLQLVEYDFLTA